LICSKFLVKEFSGEYDIRIIVALYSFHEVEHYIRSTDDHMFIPLNREGAGGGWVSVPDELTMTSLGISSGCHEVLVAISIDIYPLPSVIEET
jgi:hypothetical protein